jgi:hypothetical protein
MKTLQILNKEKTSLILIIIGASLFAIAIISFLIVDSKYEKFGQLGDFIGGIVGSIWALAGVLLFYIALTEQRKDIHINQEAVELQIKALNQQVREFELQRNEMESSRKVYEEQSKTLKIQQFESNFYSLLNVYLSIKDRLNNLDQDKDFFKTLYEKILQPYSNEILIEVHQNNMISKYTEIFNEYRGHLSHYFKCFYRIIKIIDSEHSFDEKTKVFYAKILRSQLTDFEQLILFYNSYSVYGFKARPLILKYNLLKHLPLFKRPEFKYYLDIQRDNNILFFTDFLGQFLIKHINESFELDFDSDKIEEGFKDFDCIIGIYFLHDFIELKVFCEDNISNNDIRLSEIQFSDFLLVFLYDRLILNTYLEPQKVSLTKFKTEIKNKKVFGIKIESESQLTLTFDK